MQLPASTSSGGAALAERRREALQEKQRQRLAAFEDLQRQVSAVLSRTSSVRAQIDAANTDAGSAPSSNAGSRLPSAR
jgi:predicted  nucleic acid-binding Zn-ribbon protein